MTTIFELAVEDQHWLGEPSEQSHDGCSHGGIRAVIGGVVVSSADREYGVSQSALSLLRTLEQDHSPAEPVSGGYLLCHGCGYPTHFGCSNFGTDWVVRRDGDTVLLSQPTHFDSSGETEFDVQARVPIEHYRRQVVAFAKQVRGFFASSEPRRVDEWEQEFHERFWTEFEERLSRETRAGARLAGSCTPSPVAQGTHGVHDRQSGDLDG